MQHPDPHDGKNQPTTWRDRPIRSIQNQEKKARLVVEQIKNYLLINQFH